ncbi:tRNA (adenosine(37)-N6)-threonylcarbamoyltransferase complex dimerization subunit type 1 TsaB [Spartinivicinus poritis]|uniref:tRNA threonylcarbamoyladenosine biosynthesis protein TsaB n=1 Tax=Spartinivicinus poritis TaxID=2994640 RepID=A0ABT5U377_9GAMM|nr:tRNA (adenosine(37)-N6)-threonylcarbamoyltransferase complex dimerization subunit type 1 TsaB [Spartinivicinus sp. A2-2]MDE1460426.1 tRNA (adenosine(37)-N6)-threonylcarbamoyltransferase complex dimerization subunit type 1 TsaB [Spartinivicinus sp. A2-2]
MAKLLALDTATEACSVALALNGNITEHFEIIPREHSQKILPMIDELLATAGLTIKQLDGIAFGCGPGAFTGLRIAAGITQGLSYAADLPVIPVSNLAALAHYGMRQYQADSVLCAIDARMDEVYWAQYILQNNQLTLLGKEVVKAPEQVEILQPERNWIGIGTGWKYQEILNAKLTDYYINEYPHAYDIAAIATLLFEQGKTVSSEQALPVYLRDNVAKKKSEQK